MTHLAAGLIGYLLGSLPTAERIARSAGVSLRTEGSGNPGANNVRPLGGWSLAVTILVVAAAQSATAVWVGSVLGGQSAMAVAGVAAVLGNVANIWYRMAGGKGLGATLGVMLAATPMLALIGLLVIGVLVWLIRSSGRAALGAMAVLLAVSLFTPGIALVGPWGLDTAGPLTGLVVGLSMVLAPRHLIDARMPSQTLSEDPSAF